MITKDGPKLLEYNVRLGDPETQAVLPLMDFDFAALCAAIVDGSLKDFDMKWKKEFAVAPVAVSGGYPGSYPKGKAISIDKNLVDRSDAKVFIAGAIEDRREKNEGGESNGLVTSGGRVLAVCAKGQSFDDAWKKAYDAMEGVRFEGMFFRKDIGLPGAAVSD